MGFGCSGPLLLDLSKQANGVLVNIGALVVLRQSRPNTGTLRVKAPYVQGIGFQTI